MSRALFQFVAASGWRFDTKANLPQRTLLRRGAVALLAELARPIGYLQAVTGWGGTIRSHQDMDGITELHTALAGRSPAIAVGLLDRRTTKRHIGGFAAVGKIELSVYFYSNHRRSLVEGRLEPDAVALVDDLADPGLEVAMEHAEELLVGRYPSVTKSIKSISHVNEEDLIIASEDFTIFVQRYEVEVDRVINPNRNATERLEQFHSATRTADMDEDVTPVAEGRWPTPT